MNNNTIEQARDFAYSKHANVFYEPEHIAYTSHLDKVVANINSVFDDSFNLKLAIMTGYLHDVVEDTDTSIEDLRKLFAVDVCEGVMALTKDKRLTKAEQMQDSLRRIRQASNEIAIVKIADRIANLSNPQLCWSCDKQLYYFQESIYLHKMLAYANKKIADKLAVSIQAYEIRIREAITIKVHYPTLR